MIEVGGQLEYDSPDCDAAREIANSIDRMAELLTGRREYFWDHGAVATASQLAAGRKFRLMEAGAIPRRRPDATSLA